VIQRARLVFLAAVALAVVIIAGELPLGALAHEKAAIAGSSRQLQVLQDENKSLSQQVSALNDPATIERIAHAQYGLVMRGQRSYVILPSPGDDSSGASPLSTIPLSPSEIVPNDATGTAQAGTATKSAGHGEGVWAQIENRLEFWHWAF
jgi:cell division protein FtsB